MTKKIINTIVDSFSLTIQHDKQIKRIQKKFKIKKSMALRLMLEVAINNLLEVYENAKNREKTK